jgi:uncharacterized protein YeaO (DUF488 family)
MAVSIVRLGTPRASGEGPRLGTVRRPPRGVPKSEFSTRDYYDVWLPTLAPSADLIKSTGVLHDHNRWASFARQFAAELKRPDPSHLLDALATLSHTAEFAVGCYCEDEQFCHRSILRKALSDRGASIRR